MMMPSSLTIVQKVANRPASPEETQLAQLVTASRGLDPLDSVTVGGLPMMRWRATLIELHATALFNAMVRGEQIV